MIIKSRRYNPFSISIQKKKTDANSWSLSYGDMVTTLLCFFIIFYALEKSIKRLEDEKLLHSIEHVTEKSDIQLDYMIKSLESIGGLKISKTSDFVDIVFKDAIFFKKGKAILTKDGENLINEIMVVLQKYDQKYILEIQGHSDPSQVRNSTSRWWNSNMELSVLRALNVYKYLSKNNIEKERLIVAGHGTDSYLNLKNETEEDYQRRISLRMHLIK